MNTVGSLLRARKVNYTKLQQQQQQQQQRGIQIFSGLRFFKLFPALRQYTERWGGSEGRVILIYHAERTGPVLFFLARQKLFRTVDMTMWKFSFGNLEAVDVVCKNSQCRRMSFSYNQQ